MSVSDADKVDEELCTPPEQKKAADIIYEIIGNHILHSIYFHFSENQ